MQAYEFGTRVHRRMQGKLATIIDRIEHDHHVFRAYFKNAFKKQYEKFFTFLRNELVSRTLPRRGCMVRLVVLGPPGFDAYA